MPDSPRTILEDLYRAALAAADPGRALVAALDASRSDGAGRLYLVALGKAACPMAHAAHEWSANHGKTLSGGIVVSPDAVGDPRPSLRYLVGDHPVPGINSLKAADAVERLTLELRKEDEVWVLLSGGTSSLVGAPVPGVEPADFVELHRILLGTGLEIGPMNLVRKRVSRWGGGRLALALSPARVRVFAVSDVAGDDLASIGSGPCAPDPTSATELRMMLGQRGLWGKLPETVCSYIEEVIAGLRGETPKFDDPRFSRVHTQVLVNNDTAVTGAASRAHALAYRTWIAPPLHGDATEAGRIIANQLVDAAHAGLSGCYLWGGETTVMLPTTENGQRRSGANRLLRGGRCQDLALSAAIRLHEAGVGERITLLAAGTDGRDGPTDAAGAVVDGLTAERIGNPEEYLDLHNAYPALDQSGALFRTGPTGTNVRDLVIALVTGDT